MFSRHKVDGERKKNDMGNRGLKELICTTHGHELSGVENAGGSRGTGQRGRKGRKKQNNCNSIINKIYLKSKNK